MGNITVRFIVGINMALDINECHEETFTCDANANCEDTDGSYMCECRVNFTGDGQTCSRMFILTAVTPCLNICTLPKLNRM